MLKQRARIVATGLRLLDLGMLAVAFPIAYLVRDRLLGARFTGLYPIERYWPLLAVSLLLWLGAAWMSQVYAAYRTRPLHTELVRLGRAMGVVGLVIAAAGYLSKQQDVSRLLVGLYYATAFGLMVANRLALRLFARAARRRGYNTRNFAVAGTGELAETVVESIALHREWGVHFAGYILEDDAPTPPSPSRVLGRLGRLGELLENHVVDEVIFAVPRERLDDIESAVALCEEQGVGVRVVLNFFPNRIAKLSLEELDGLPVLAFSTTPSDEASLWGKRAFDLVASGIALLVLAPLFAIVAAAIKLDSQGPVFFRQRRIGKNGREFTLYKFRSMYLDAEARLAELRHRNEMQGPVFKLRDDPRVTRVGRLLRKTSIDELPQFWNVLRGEMSVVGPRPPVPDEVRAYKRWQRRRLSVKPGLTCTWQVSGRNEIDFERWMELDLHYIDNWSLWHDLKIVLRTIPAVFIGRGAR